MGILTYPTTFPELHYRKRYKSFPSSKGNACGIGCAYNCCDPIMASMIVPRVKAENDLSRVIRDTGTVLRRDIEGEGKVLAPAGFFVAPSFFRDCLVEGPDFGINTDSKRCLQIYVLFSCPWLALDGLCSVYDKQRLDLCEKFKHCPEYRIKDSMPESSFVTLAFNYWLMRKLITSSAAKDADEAALAWKTNENAGIRRFLQERGTCPDMLPSTLIE